MHSIVMDIDDYKRLLLKKKAELNSLDESSADSRKAVTLDQTSVGRLSRMDALQGQAMNKAIGERRKQALLRIESALKRIECDDYGYCISCDEEIPEKRLSFDPASLYCMECAGK